MMIMNVEQRNNNKAQILSIIDINKQNNNQL